MKQRSSTSWKLPEGATSEDRFLRLDGLDPDVAVHSRAGRRERASRPRRPPPAVPRRWSGRRRADRVDRRRRSLPVSGAEQGGADLSAGVYRLTFDTGAYFAATGQVGFYPEVSVTFEITDPAAHHHVPLLLSPFAYSTYRGS